MSRKRQIKDRKMYFSIAQKAKDTMEIERRDLLIMNFNINAALNDYRKMMEAISNKDRSYSNLLKNDMLKNINLLYLIFI